MKRTSLLRRTPLRPMSKKRQKESRIYSEKRKALLEAKPICEICCSRKSTDCHHKRGRSGSLYLDETHFMALCRPCHDFLGRNPSLAFEMGYREKA